MSYRKDRTIATTGFAGADFAAKTNEEINDLFKSILEDGLHGLCFSLYEDGQKPGDVITEAQVRRRMEILKPYIKWIRTFSCTDGNELIPIVAKEYGIKTLVGGWLGKDAEINKREIEGLIDLAKKGFVDIAAVGNEVLYREDLSKQELIDFIQYVRSEIPAEIPVGYVDAYYEFTANPDLVEVCDLILCNCYPFWEGCSIDYSLIHMKSMYYEAMAAGKGKKVIITETGWPSKGESLHAAVPSHENSRNYFINTQLWTKANDIETFYFASFDESWKVGPEGEVGAYWGIWDKNEQLKF